MWGKAASWNFTNNMLFPKTKRKSCFVAWSGSLTCEGISGDLDGGCEPCIRGGGGGRGHMCGFNSGFARLSSSIKSRLYWRARAGKAVCPAASQHFLGCRDIWWHFSSLYRQCIHPYSEVTATLSLMPEPSLFPQQSCSCYLVKKNKKKKIPPLPFLNSLSSEKTSEQICRVHPLIPAV